MASYDTIPKGAEVQPTKFNVSIPEEKVQQMKQLISLSPIGPETFENLQESNDLEGFGISRKWLETAKKEWEENYDWRATEAHINSYPNFTLPVTDDDNSTYTIHFVALFSTNPSAIPIAFFHGWPGSFLEFPPLLQLLKDKYPSPDQLPYHVIVPSLPGFAFSDRPPKDRDWTAHDSSRLMHKLLLALGFGTTGYAVQGGDIGSFISRSLAVKYDACKAVHLNFSPTSPPTPANHDHSVNLSPTSPPNPSPPITPAETAALPRGASFRSAGMAYALTHATRPSTIGLVLSTSPLALLAWIGEKFLTWTTTPPPLTHTLAHISLYWLTATFPTSIYTYRHGLGPNADKVPFHEQPAMRIPKGKPFGFSWFPDEIMPVPRAWVERTAVEGVVGWWRAHGTGGHFAAMERPKELLGDVEEFLGEAWGKKQ